MIEGPHARFRRGCLVLALATLVFGCKDAPSEAAAGQPEPTAAEALPVQEAALPAATGLAHFYRDLQRLEAHQITHVHILQLGDSHTAGDVFSGRLRTLFQQRFGDAGRGMMPPGMAFEGIRQKEVSLSQTGRWEIENSLKLPDAGPYGVTGFVARSLGAGAQMTVTPNGPDGFDTATVDYLQRPNGGVFEVLLDGRVAGRVSTAGPLNKLGHYVINAPEGARELAIVTGSAGIAITAWGIERRGRGVLYESQGIVSAQVTIVNRWDPEIMRRDLENLKPSLIVMAYGTNEGFEDDLDQASYAENFAAIVSRLHQFAPEASLLFIAPADGERVDPHCAKRKTNAMACRWLTPPQLATVRLVQRDAARALGAGYWDWSTLMAGPGGIDRWVRQDPPLARQDHVHFTLQGYEIAADALFGRMMEGYKAFTAPKAPRRQ